jgi:hypothetical protein
MSRVTTRNTALHEVTALLQAWEPGDETAAALKVSPDTVMRDSKVAKVWLARELEEGRRDG